MTLAFGTRQPCDDLRARIRERRSPCPRRDKPWVLATAILGSSLVFIEGSVVNLALPAMQRDFGATSAGVQWVMTGYLLVLGAFMLIGGSLGDRYGLRRVFIAGTSLFGLAAAACALSPTMPLLVAARLAQGLGGALLVPTSLALIGSHFDEEERGRAIGTWAGASALTTALGPVIGGGIVDGAGWHAVFLLVVPFAALTAAIAWWRVPPGGRQTDGRLDTPGALLVACALGLLIYGLVSSRPLDWRLVLVGLSVAAGWGFVWRERTFDAPMLPLGLFRSRRFSGANLMTMLLYFALSGALYFLPFNLIQVQGYSAMQAGAAFLPFTLILGFGSTWAGDLIRRLDPRRLLTFGPLIAAAGFVALAIPGTNASYVTGFLPGIVTIGVGMTLSVAPLTTVVMNAVGERQAGVASGVNNTAARVAGVLAVAALTAVAVGQFSDELARQLRDQGVPDRLIEELAMNASQLAELQPPAGIAESSADAIRDSIALAYVAAFRQLVIVCGLLSAVSGLVAWLTLSGAAGATRRPSA